MRDTALTGPAAIARDVMQGLGEGRFVPGQRLAEPDLMGRYGAARSTVREALGQLVAAGIVAQVPHKGAQIRHLTRRAAIDILRVAEALLGLTARQAAEAVRAGADPAALSTAAQTYAAATHERARHRARYYREIAALAGNAELDRLLPSLQTPLIRAQLRGLRPPSDAARAAIVAAISTGDPDAAEGAARAHVGALLALLPQAPDSAFAPDPAA